jgi:hypothetical protein
MPFRKPMMRAAVITAVVTVLVVAGGQAGVGPLAAVTPPDQVRDPREMLARAVQSVIDASTVPLEIAARGHVPATLVGRPEATVTLDGTTVTMDVRPQDARSHTHVESPALGIDLEAVTLWDTVAYRSGTGPWKRASLGAVAGGSGIDANPLTLADRLRAWLATPGAPTPTSTEVACASASGRCHEIRLDAGAAQAGLLAGLFPVGSLASVGPTRTIVVVQVDAQDLRPVHVEAMTANLDGSLSLRVTVDATGWDGPSVIADPPEG